MSNYANPASLVSTQWVADHLADPTVRLVEASWGDDEYRSGHISGAVYWSFAEDLKKPELSDAPDADAMAVLLSRAGIEAATTIVLYGNLSNLVAAYAFWLLKHYGHQDVRLLDGGRQRWLDEGRPVSTALPVYLPTSYRIEPADRALRAQRDLILQAIDDPDWVIVDLRAPEMYLGVHKANAQRGGHIPGAINVPAVNCRNHGRQHHAPGRQVADPPGQRRPLCDPRGHSPPGRGQAGGDAGRTGGGFCALQRLLHCAGTRRAAHPLCAADHDA